MTVRTRASVLGLGLVGCVGACSYDYRYSESETREWDASEVSAIEIDTSNGRITLTVDGSDPITADIKRWVSGRNRSDAEKHIGSVDIDDSLGDGILTLDADGPGGLRDYGASFDIRSSALQWANLSTDNGKVVVTGFDGDLDARTTNGRISAGFVALRSNGVVDLKTTNGGITVFLPADVSAAFDADTTNGGIDVVGFADVDFSKDDSTHKIGTIGAGSATLTLRTTNGGITIQSGDGYEVAGDDDDDDDDDDD